MKELDYPSDFPTKDKKRGLRKAKFQTVVKRCKEYIKNTWGSYNLRGMTQEEYDKWVEANAIRQACGAHCDCWMCRNPRRVFKGKDARTIQEKRHEDPKNS